MLTLCHVIVQPKCMRIHVLCTKVHSDVCVHVLVCSCLATKVFEGKLLARVGVGDLEVG